MTAAATALPADLEELVQEAVAAAVGEAVRSAVSSAVREAVRDAVERVVPGAVAVAVERAVAASLVEARSDELDRTVTEARRALEETACEAVRGLTSVAARLVNVVDDATSETSLPGEAPPQRFVGRASPRPLPAGSPTDAGPGLPYFVIALGSDADPR